MPQITCPVCENHFDLDKSEAPPFCSHRCKLIDLGRWASEDYGMPVERHEDPDEFPEDF